MKKTVYLYLVFIYLISLVPFSAGAQETYNFSLEEAINFAMENNYDILSSYKDIESAEQQVKEYMAIGFPQINASINYTDYISLPTMIIPAGTF